MNSCIEIATKRFIGMSKADALTDKEREVCDFLKNGKTANEISNALGISSRTVEFHTENIKNKLGCHSKLELAVLLNKII